MMAVTGLTDAWVWEIFLWLAGYFVAFLVVYFLLRAFLGGNRNSKRRRR